MRLYRTRGTPFITVCYVCKRRISAGDGSAVYADPNGPAFEAYYCADCAKGHELLEPSALRDPA